MSALPLGTAAEDRRAGGDAPPPEEEWLRYVRSLQTKGEHHVRRFRLSFSLPVILSAMAGDFLVTLSALWLARHSLGLAGGGWQLVGESLLLLVVLNQFGGYQQNRLLRFGPAAATVLKSSLAWIVICPGAASLLLPAARAARAELLLGAAEVCVGLLLWRSLYRAVFSQTVTARRLRKRILFLGWSEQASRLAQHLSVRESDSFELIGRLSLTGEPGADVASASAECAAPIGSEEHLDLLLSQDVADVVIASGPDAPQKSLLLYANLCEKWLVDFKLIPSCFQVLVSGLNLENLGGTPLLGISRLPLDSTLNMLLKRVVDIVGATVGLLMAAPIIARFRALIWLEERRGPIFFAQERYGRKGRKFKMYKLRSMKVGSDKSDHLNQSTQRADPRVLRIGAFMRKYNIDEVPQFWNVLRGEMSLVGPRPERTYHSELLSDEIPHYNARYNIYPGLTGWAQVNGLRGDTDLTERVKCDLHYIENWSLWLDFRIMVRTFIQNRNAY